VDRQDRPFPRQPHHHIMDIPGYMVNVRPVFSGRPDIGNDRPYGRAIVRSGLQGDLKIRTQGWNDSRKDFFNAEKKRGLSFGI